MYERIIANLESDLILWKIKFQYQEELASTLKDLLERAISGKLDHISSECWKDRYDSIAKCCRCFAEVLTEE